MFKRLAEVRRALAIGAVLLVPGCGLDGLFGNDGARVQVVLSRDGGNALTSLVQDSASALADRDDDEKRGLGSWRFQAATVTLSSILARTHDGELVDLDIEMPVTVDVVRIDGGKQVVLPDGFLPADVYDQVVMVITAVQGTTFDGSLVTIEPPGGGWTAVVPICPLEVLEGETTTVGIALNVRSSFLQVGSWWSFHPRFRSLVNCEEDGDA
jgi:hypothetical protein